jgi:phage shock protein C
MAKNDSSTVKKLYRKKERKLLGVCAGLGDYFGVDVTIIRLIWVVVSAVSGFVPGIVAYVVVSLVMPEESRAT